MSEAPESVEEADVEADEVLAGGEFPIDEDAEVPSGPYVDA